MNVSGEQENLRAYLLGRLSDDKLMQTFEEKILVDDHFNDELAFAEDRLIEDFLDEQLSAEESARFRDFFLISNERRGKFRLICGLFRFRGRFGLVLVHGPRPFRKCQSRHARKERYGRQRSHISSH